MGPIQGLATTKEKMGRQKTSDPILISQNLFKRRPRRNASSDVPNMGPTYTLPTMRNHSKQILVVRMSLTKQGKGREYRMSRGRPQLPY